MVFVAVTQQWIVGGYLVDEIIGALGQIHIVDVNEIEAIAFCVAAVVPLVFPSGSGNDAGVFRAFLIVERYGKFRGSLHASFEA